MKILIDNGHGVETPGKQSPDGRLHEWAYARVVAKRIEQCLRCKGYDVERLVPEKTDVSLKERCRRVNAVCKEHGKENVLLVSVHVNAAGNGSVWGSARGFSAHVGLNASGRSKELAEMLWNEAIYQGLQGNRCVPAEGKRYTSQNLAICRDTACAAVLTENLFMDNEDDVRFLLSERGRAAVTATHVNAIVQYIECFYGK